MCTPQWSKTNTYCAPPALQPVNKQNQVVHLYKCKNYLWLRICKYVKFQSLAVNLWFINVSHLLRNERNELIKTFFFAFVLTPAVSLRQAAGGTNCPVQFSFSDMRKVSFFVAPYGSDALADLHSMYELKMCINKCASKHKQPFHSSCSDMSRQEKLHRLLGH